MKESKQRADITSDHVDAGRNILPSERAPFCLIPNNLPFRFGKDKDIQSLHTLLTTNDFFFESIGDLDETHHTLYTHIRRFCSILYTAHMHLNSKYQNTRVGSLIDQFSYKEFHEHRYLLDKNATISGAASKSFRTELDTEGMNAVTSELQITRDLLLDKQVTYTQDPKLETMHQQALAYKQQIAELLLLSHVE